MTRPLASFDGAEAPAALAADLACFAKLGPAAQAGFAQAIDAVLPDPLPARAEAVVTALAERLACDAADLARAAMAFRLLLRAAARADLSMDAVEADVRALAPDASDAVVSMLRRAFEPAKAKVQSELLAKTVTAHGKVLADVEWRLETITASSHGRGFRLPLVTLTLRYEENRQVHAITLHVLPSVLRKLKATLERIVS